MKTPEICYWVKFKRLVPPSLKNVSWPSAREQVQVCTRRASALTTQQSSSHTNQEQSVNEDESATSLFFAPKKISHSFASSSLRFFLPACHHTSNFQFGRAARSFIQIKVGGTLLSNETCCLFLLCIRPVCLTSTSVDQQKKNLSKKKREESDGHRVSWKYGIMHMNNRQWQNVFY